MFYQCPKCKEAWQHPLSKCPQCFEELKGKKPGKATVVGVSKTTIPTLLHPNVPYFVLVLEDKNGNRWTHKSTKEYKIGDSFSVEPHPQKGSVGIWRSKYNPLEAIEKNIELIGGLDLNANSRVLIVPTLVSPKHPHFAENTSPQFLESMIQYLLAKKVKTKNIRVGAQSFNDFPVEASAQKSRLLEVCLQNKIEPLDLSKKEFVSKKSGDITFEVSKESFDTDLIINLPIMKLDPRLKVKGALENILKLISKDSYLKLKYLYEYPRLIKAAQRVLPSYITIAEAVSIQKADRYTTFLGLVLSSFNPFNLERVFAEITMQKDLPDYLKNIKIGDIEIAGRRIKEVQYDVEKFY